MARKKNRQRPPEQEAVRTTIVGGRPPGSGKSIGNIPRGIEVLVKKASVDAKFKRLLIDQRARVAKEIDLDLEPAEVMMLDNVPAEQLEAIIARTKVNARSRGAFLGKAAAVMLAALGAGTFGCGRDDEPAVEGMRPDRPEDKRPAAEAQVEKETEARPEEPTVRGIRADRPGAKPPASQKAKSGE